MAKESKKKKKGAPKAGAQWMQQPKVVAILLLVLTFVLYGNTLNHELVLDDLLVVSGNSYVQEGLSGIPDILAHGYLHGSSGDEGLTYRPVALITFAVEEQFFGGGAGAGHLWNLLYYFLAALLVFLVCRKWFGEYPDWVPLLITLAFLFHPIHTEVVANIKSRDELLAFLFLAGSLLALHYYVKDRGISFLLLSLFGFLLALLSKEVAMTFLAVYPLVFFYIYRQKMLRVFIGTLPFLGVFVAYFLLRSSVLGEISVDEEAQIVNNALVAAEGNGQRFATALIILVYYLWLMVFPHPLSWDYSFNQIPIQSFGDPIVWGAILVLAGLAAVVVWSLRKRSIYGFAVAFFFITLALVSNLFVLIGATMAERFLFLPSLAFSIVSVLGIVHLLKASQASEFAKKKTMILAVFGGLFLLYGIKTVDRNGDWKSNDVLFAAGLEASPNSARAHSASGIDMMGQARETPVPQEKIRLYQEAIVKLQQSVQILPQHAEAWYNMGVCYASLGNREEAYKIYLHTISADSGYVAAYNNAGVYHFENSQYPQAEEYFEKCIQLDSTNADCYANLGAIRHNQGNREAAINYYLKALQHNPQAQGARNNLIRAYEQMGQPKKADLYR